MTEIVNICDIKTRLIDGVTSLVKNTQVSKRIFRIEFEISSIELLAWLDNQSDKTKIYFSGKDNDDFVVAAIGITNLIENNNQNTHKNSIKKIMSLVIDSKLKYYGGIAFPEKNIGAEWKSFGKLKFILPMFEIIRSKDKTYFACNVSVDDSFKLSEFIKKANILVFNLKDKFMGKNISKPIKRTMYPDYNKWENTINEITNGIDAGNYNKIVMARKLIYEFQDDINPIALLKELKKNVSNRYCFLFQFKIKESFLGISMERLYRRVSKDIQSEAVAGSIERGKNNNSDTALSNILLNSTKNNDEQAFVEIFVNDQLSRLCSKLQVSNREILTLRESFHIKSEFYGEIKETITDWDIIKALHPTPAVGGTPWSIVANLIYEYEQFFRGWYAGIVGYIGEDSADFSVALRSGLLYNKTLSLYTGVGIVKGSQPEREWDEGNWKVKNYEEIFVDGYGNYPES